MNYQSERYGKTSGQKRSKGLYKSLSIILILVMVLACFSGCGKSTNENGNDLVLTKITDNLYEITYTDDFDWKKAETPDLSAFACSGVQNGQYRGRNYDWVYGDTDICVIHTTITDIRPHASVGVIDLSFYDNSKKSYDLDKIPFFTVDGINDAGVCIQANVIPYGENGALNHTKTTEDDLIGSVVVRYILDHAGSVEDAIAIFESKDIYAELGTINELHWMISGPLSNTDKTTKTVVVEVFPDGIHVTENFIDDKPIMTNFNISNFNGSAESIGIGSGYERWQILNENFNQATSIMGTFDLMEKVYYSKLYDLYSDRFWYSEYNGVDLGYCYKVEELKGLLGEEVYNYYMNNYGGVYYNPALYDGEKKLNGDIEKAGILRPAVQVAADRYEAQNKKDGSIWITSYTSVYDLEKLTLDIQARESQDHLHFTIE